MTFCGGTEIQSGNTMVNLAEMGDTTETELLLSLGAVAVDNDTLVQQVLVNVQESFNDKADIAVINEENDVPAHESNAAVVTTDINLLQDGDGPPTVNKVEDKDNPSGLSSESILQALLRKDRFAAVPAANRESERINAPLIGNLISEQAETDDEIRIRNGHMTPFGTVLETDSLHQESCEKGGGLNVNSYLTNQLALQEQFKKDQRKKKQQKRKRRVETVSTDDDDLSDSNPKPNDVSKSKLSRDPLRMNVLFPKQRAKKMKMGTKSSKSKINAGRSPGLVPSEEASMYLNENDDSDYVPEDHFSSDSESYRNANHKNEKNKKVPKKLMSKRMAQKLRTAQNVSSPESSEYDSDETKEKPKRSRKVGEYTDDGNFKFYQDRVQHWKETETRFTSEVHKMDGGFKLPKYIWDSLYKYQKVGVKWLWELHQLRAGGILSDEMGLGKTIQVICFLAGVSCSNVLFRFSEFRGIGPSIIVCPATVMNQWVQEFHRWWPPFRIGLLHESGSFTGRKEEFIRSMHSSRGIIVTTYTAIVQNQDELLKYTWDYLILDEGHKIRNPDAQVTIAVKRIATPHRIILSGSPLQNNLKELWSLFDFVTPGRLGTLPTFLEKFAVPITQGGYSNASDIQVATAYKCATTLRDIINPYLLRRMKSDVKDHLQLPSKNEQVLFCKVTEEQKTVYKGYLKSDQIRNVVNGEHNLFVSLSNLRKICNHPHLFDGGPNQENSGGTGVLDRRIPKYRASGGKLEVGGNDIDEEGEDLEVDESTGFGHWRFSGKMIVVRTLLRVWQKQNQKVLLFSQSRQMLCILEKFLQQEKFTYLRLDGGTPIGSRQIVIDKFNKDPSVFVFLLTTRVGGLGVNLTGANRVIIFDPDWNPSTDLQARERAWRIGQGREVTIYRLISSGTIEEKIYHRQIFKQFLTNRVLKDPRQKRFFKQNQLLELFSFNDGTGETETELIFEGTDSTVPRPRKRGRSSTVTETEARENSKGKFRGVPNLVKQKAFQADKESDSEIKKTETKQTLSQDEYVLRKLFKKSVVDVALKHDRIVDAEQPDHAIIEKEAELVAKDAVRMLKKSREQCWDATSGKVTWTGSHGTLRKIKNPVKSVKTPETKKVAAEGQDPLSSLFSTPATSLTDKGPTTAAELFAIIRARKRRNLIDTEPKPVETNTETRSEVQVGDVEPSRIELLADIRAFAAFRGTVDGEVTTEELVAEFGSKLPPGDSALFKQMLLELCTPRQVQGRRVWRIKPEFR